MFRELLFVVIKAVVKWPFCLLPQRLVFQYPEQMVWVSMDESLSRWGFNVAGLDGVRLVCMFFWFSSKNTPVLLSVMKKALNSLFSLTFFFQTLEEPPYLTVGTDVSAKYRGAFCEAKIKTAKRLVKAKVSHSSESF